MAYEITAVSAADVSEQFIENEAVISDIAKRWVEYCVMPAAVRDQFAEWGVKVIEDASRLSDEGILRVYEMMDQLEPSVHAEAQSRFTARREELARQAAGAEALAAERRLGDVSWRAAARLQRTQSDL